MSASEVANEFIPNGAYRSITYKKSIIAKTITTEKIRFNVNKKDLDKNISELDKNIDKLNNMISEVNDPETKNALMNAKMELQDTLGKLMRLKARNEKK